MYENTEILADFELPEPFAWEPVLRCAGFLNDNPYNSSVYGLPDKNSRGRVCSVAVHGFHFTVHPFDECIVQIITPLIEAAIQSAYDCKCSVSISHEVRIHMWK